MFVKAKKILVSELMYAKGMDEEEAAEWLDDILSGVGAKKTSRRRSRRRPSGLAEAVGRADDLPRDFACRNVSGVVDDDQLGLRPDALSSYAFPIGD